MGADDNRCTYSDEECESWRRKNLRFNIRSEHSMRYQAYEDHNDDNDRIKKIFERKNYKYSEKPLTGLKSIISVNTNNSNKKNCIDIRERQTETNKSVIEAFKA